MEYRHLLSLVALVAATNAVSVTIDATPRQTLASFGASGAWWPNDLNHFPTSVQQQLGEFLFSESGLYLSSYRYNMGGNGGNDTQQVTTYDAIVESFLLRNGTYDWSRDHAGVTFLEMAQNYSVPYITFFINAAPSAIAENGAACGWNMTSAKIPSFADYVQTALSHWTDHGIDIKYISPMNEPDNDRSTCTQEGMGVSPSLRANVIRTIRSALNKSSAKSVGIIADETSQITTQADVEDPIWLPSAAPYMSHIAVHDYDYATDSQLQTYYAQVLDLTNNRPPPVKFTEICCSTAYGSGSQIFGAQYDPTITNALIVAQYVWQFLTIVQAVSFDCIDGQQCATAINETSGYNSGLISIDPNYNQTQDYTLYYTKRAFMMKHFAYFHRPGSVRFDVPQSQLPMGVNAIASKLSNSSNPRWASWHDCSTGSTWSVLFLNNQTCGYNMSLEAPGYGAKLLRAVQTTNTSDFAEVDPLPAQGDDGSVVFELPAESLFTLQFTLEDGERPDSMAF